MMTRTPRSAANALTVYWIQRYMSAANIALLEGDSQYVYVDLFVMNEQNLLPLIERKWKSGTVPWAADDD
jgi:hypothetical protein